MTVNNAAAWDQQDVRALAIMKARCTTGGAREALKEVLFSIKWGNLTAEHMTRLRALKRCVEDLAAVQETECTRDLCEVDRGIPVKGMYCRPRMNVTSGPRTCVNCGRYLDI